jgi:hypothetical protein
MTRQSVETWFQRLSKATPRARDVLRRDDWTDPIALYERLIGIYVYDVVPSGATAEERALVSLMTRMVVKTLAQLTGLEPETLRTKAQEDAEVVKKLDGASRPT